MPRDQPRDKPKDQPRDQPVFNLKKTLGSRPLACGFKTRFNSNSFVTFMNNHPTVFLFF